MEDRKQKGGKFNKKIFLLSVDDRKPETARVGYETSKKGFIDRSSNVESSWQLLAIGRRQNYKLEEREREN